MSAEEDMKPHFEQVRDNAALHRFEIEAYGATAIAEYRLSGGVMDFHRTFSPPEQRGKGLAAALMKGALLEVRRRGLKVKATCSYVDAFMRRHPEFADLRE